MKRIYNIVLLILTTATPAFSQEDNQINFGSEDSVKKIIMALPEVRAKDKVYDSITSRVQRIQLHITPPDAVTNLYKVEAGYQGNNRFQPHFYFYVDLPGKMIYIEDLEQGDRTTLDEWRRRKTITAASN
ncbi:hypothetical protein F0919_05220 [Taibaiella lutea]|uniref:Uncharacterized protein n=1 Tax=Taibaiella lutea TaxID=2608001 RepID=A0A5M6CPR1_9BACT|nr:hypothetical protein [Taibaiella lutea]KAA5537077.1 hypothetical protein F0919_05220 [Taibaiella lutea]